MQFSIDFGWITQSTGCLQYQDRAHVFSFIFNFKCICTCISCFTTTKYNPLKSIKKNLYLLQVFDYKQFSYHFNYGIYVFPRLSWVIDTVFARYRQKSMRRSLKLWRRPQKGSPPNHMLSSFWRPGTNWMKTVCPQSISFR